MKLTGKAVRTGYEIMTGAEKREEFEFAGTRHDLICAVWKRLIVSKVSVD